MNISVIVSTYNAPRYLDLVLGGLMNQSDDRFECLVADDGSGPETASVINRFSEKRDIVHSWHKDLGFRLAASRNRAAALASGDWLAFLDGDCIPAPDYVSDLKNLARKLSARHVRAFIQGHRVILGEQLSDQLSLDAQVFSAGWIWRNRFEIGNIKNAFRWPGPLWPGKRIRGIRGCSMAFSAADFRGVNGFDEEFEGWGHEDKDIVNRLFRSGVSRVDARGRMIVYHLYHPEVDRAGETANLSRAISERPIVAVRGLNSGIK